MVKELYAGGSATADVGEGAAARKGVMKLFSVWFGSLGFWVLFRKT